MLCFLTHFWSSKMSNSKNLFDGCVKIITDNIMFFGYHDSYEVTIREKVSEHLLHLLL